MGRKQTYSQTELLDTTKRLLLEHGYDGFHLKLLSQHLHGARSTIYQYYGSKEQIVAACMKRVMTLMLDDALKVDESDCMNALQQLLGIYVQESTFHQLLGEKHKINTTDFPDAANDLTFVEQSHETLKAQLTRLFERAQQENKLRKDVPLPVLIGVFFNLIDTPNMLNLPADKWSKYLFEIWFTGVQK
ncbi:TetR/AcrR family transcriptional regulator [Gorillibacterium massiliense]|uniref:TetR/AcrR family transcriptional regulator n=1 Tax=Gorillibacterium massiliense TaxID=1280390 RepID=UPI0004B08DC5|nr:TetR/AcrR family transcriptional regulator [Gorillibacterium massiliense]